MFRVKFVLVRLGKSLITSLGLKANVRPHKYKKARYTIRNFCKKDLSKIIREFENYHMKVMRRIVPNMSLPTVTFT